jgi:hypothetical protein
MRRAAVWRQGLQKECFSFQPGLQFILRSLTAPEHPVPVMSQGPKIQIAIEK